MTQPPRSRSSAECSSLDQRPPQQTTAARRHPASPLRGGGSDSPFSLLPLPPLLVLPIPFRDRREPTLWPCRQHRLWRPWLRRQHRLPQPNPLLTKTEQHFELCVRNHVDDAPHE